MAAVAALLLRPWEGLRRAVEPGPASARAYVVRAVDGDTIEVRLDGRVEDVRYIGVDTPETVKPGTPVQCFGERASRFDKQLVTHRRVRLVFGVERRDVYGRLLAYVYLGHRFVNAELARMGLPALTNPVIDTLAIARKKLPGQRASLDALCSFYNIDNSARTFHGALLDAQLLSDVYVELMGGLQGNLLSDITATATATAADVASILTARSIRQSDGTRQPDSS